MVALFCTLSPSTGLAAGVSKTMRVEHDRPLVVVSQKAVLVLEFLKEPAENALVPHEEPDTRHCRARYRYQLFDGASESITKGHGTVEEFFQVVSSTATGRQVNDKGSRTGIDAGEFHLWWSEGSAGSRSWVYYRADSGIRFVQQPQRITFDAVDRELFRRYLDSRNIKELVVAGQTVQVIGPAVFSNDLPDETPVSARIESCRMHEGALELTLSDLAANKNYVIESSCEPTAGNWNVVHLFIAREAKHDWSDPLARDVTAAFYRIREGR